MSKKEIILRRYIKNQLGDALQDIWVGNNRVVYQVEHSINQIKVIDLDYNIAVYFRMKSFSCYHWVQFISLTTSGT
jgi:hypothetical protein